MLLSDQVYQYIIDNYDAIQTEEQERAVLQVVVNMFLKKFSEDIRNSKEQTIKDAKVIFQRLCITWDFIAERLQKEGKPYLKKDGFRLLIQDKPEFKAITQ